MIKKELKKQQRARKKKLDEKVAARNRILEPKLQVEQPRSHTENKTVILL
jgi:hypothetical protein